MALFITGCTPHRNIGDGGGAVRLRQPHLGHHRFDLWHIFGVVQLPELAALGLDLDAEHLVAVFHEAQLLQPFKLFKRADLP